MALFYFFVICGLLGWELRWFYGVYIVNAIIIFVLDRFLIAVNHTDSSERIIGIKISFISLLYRRSRWLYTMVYIFVFPVLYFLVIGPFSLFHFVFTNKLSLEMFVDLIRTKTVQTITKTDNLNSIDRYINDYSYNNDSMIGRYGSYIHSLFNYRIESSNYFNDKLIITSVLRSKYPNDGMVYISKLYFFKKFQNFKINLSGYNHPLVIKDTLYLTDSRKIFVTKDNDKYTLFNINKPTQEKNVITFQ